MIPASAIAAGPIDSGADAGASRACATCRGDPTRSATSRPSPPLAARHPECVSSWCWRPPASPPPPATAFVAVRATRRAWACQTDSVAARFGRSGTRPLADRRSGDGTTPAGVFPLGTVTAWDGQTFSVFGNSPDPGVRANVDLPTGAQRGLLGRDADTARYNHLVNRPNCAGPATSGCRGSATCTRTPR